MNARDGNDWITTDNWGVSVFGGRGNDIIELAGPENYAEGGPGYDYFVFDAFKLEYDETTVDWAHLGDYQDGVDKIVFLNGTGGLTSFAGLAPYMSQVGDDVVIALAGLPAITIETTKLTDLDASDFLFVNQPAALVAGMNGQAMRMGSTVGLETVSSGGYSNVSITGTNMSNSFMNILMS